jgi:hypothetical protein
MNEQRRIVAYLDSVQARLASLRELQSATGEELSTLRMMNCLQEFEVAKSDSMQYTRSIFSRR